MIIIIPAIIILSLYITNIVINAKYENFIQEHSKAVRNLQGVNQWYTFATVPSFDLVHAYDNEKFYANISPKDYLVYQLMYIQKDVKQAMALVEENKIKYADYQRVIDSVRLLDQYDTDKIPKLRRYLKIKEQKMFNKSIQTPCIHFTIKVYISLTNIKGAHKTCKSEVFDAYTINSIIDKLNNKSNGFYFDNDIWESICRVERGKVTNKIRFAVYNRDGNRCRRCGSTRDLEVDHIFPISKGGKSNFDNLQTLCHRCNSLKSNIVQPNTRSHYSTNNSDVKFCALCGAPLILKKGKYGSFYGCSNYPTCKFIHKL